MKKLLIAIDFDGTCVTHDFPWVGVDIGAAPILKKLVAAGHRLTLFTMRSDMEKPKSDDPDIIGVGGAHLTAAINWFKANDIPLNGVQTTPGQESWTHSPKAYAHLYIDDAALGCPLKTDSSLSPRAFVDWESVEILLAAKGVL